MTEKVKSNVEKGVPGDETDLMERKKAFGANTYPRKKGRSFWVNIDLSHCMFILKISSFV